MPVLVDGEIILYGTVGDMIWGDFFTGRDVVDALAQVGRSKDIVVRINSGGGFTDDGVAIFNALKAHTGMVRVYIDGVAASSASVIAMAGDEIIMRAGSTMMIHDPAMLTVGDAAAHEKSVEQMNTTANAIAEIYSEQTGKTPEECRADMREESWLTPDDAVAQGYADRVEASDKPAEPVMFNYRIFQHPPERMVALADKRNWPKAGLKRAAMSAVNHQQELSMTEKEQADKKAADAAAAAEQAAKDTAAKDAAAKTEADKAAAVSDAKKTTDAAARARCKAILDSEDAKGREAQARTLAFETDLTPEQAIAVLKTGAKATAAGGVFAAAMNAGGNPKVGDGGGNEDETDETAAKRIVSFHPNFKRSA